MSIIKPTAKVPMSFQISQYVKNNPKAKAAEVAKALNTTVSYVYNTVHKLKNKAAKKAPITKKVIDERLKLAKIEGQKKMVRVYTSNSPLNRSITAHIDQLTHLSPEQTERLVESLGQPRIRMQVPERFERESVIQETPKVTAAKERKAEEATAQLKSVLGHLMPDNVNHPAHYKVGGIETIDFIEAKKLNYNLGNVIKYTTRAGHKNDLVEDLKKARWYLNREISKLDGAEQ